jgi:cytochrome c553
MPGVSGDIKKGKVKAELCQGCHGLDGISVSSIIPNLAGQKEEYLVVSLKAFKSGSRKNGIMSSIVAGISNDDIADISAYYSNLTMGKASE